LFKRVAEYMKRSNVLTLAHRDTVTHNLQSLAC